MYSFCPVGGFLEIRYYSAIMVPSTKALWGLIREGGLFAKMIFEGGLFGSGAYLRMYSITSYILAKIRLILSQVLWQYFCVHCFFFLYLKTVSLKCC